MSITVRADRWMPPGKIALVRARNVVWIGDLSAPFEDVECDEAIVSQEDFECLVRKFGPEQGRTKQ